MADRQRATTMYFIDQLALRAGNEKGDDEADTVGCCSLRCEHVTLEAPNFIIFDFLGKDSIRYYNRVAVEAQVFKNIRLFKENKEEGDNLFDRVNVILQLPRWRKLVLTNLLDVSSQQAPCFIYEGSDGQGVSYLQRLHNFPRAAGPRHAKERYGAREAKRVQSCQPHGRHTLQPSKECTQDSRTIHGKDA